MNPLLRFANLPPNPPQTRAPLARTRDFDEIAHVYTPLAGASQSSRCSQCGIPMCQSGCPLANNIPDWLALAAVGRMREAYELSAATSSMPEICGRVCPQDRLCEGTCVVEPGFGAVTIGAVEKWIGDMAWENGWIAPIAQPPPTNRHIAIVGAGPAGLTAAEGLRSCGHQVTIFDRHDRPGGLLMYGIPGFKLDKQVVSRRTGRLVDAGVVFQQDFDVGVDIDFVDLVRKHDAVLLACGVYAAKSLSHNDNQGLIPALDYLTSATRATVDGLQIPSGLNAAGRRVVVIGGGDTAMDCVRTATRQGASSVTCLYRRDRANMPGSGREVGYAEEEGVRFEFLASPTRFVCENGRICAVESLRTRLTAPDAGGRRVAVPTTETLYHDADLVIAALGYDPEPIARFGEPRLATTAAGTLWVDPLTGETSLPGVFAAGDIVRGSSLVVWAIRDGREVAKSMHRWLQRQPVRGRELARV